MRQQPPAIEFPCKDYPVKIMGNTGAEIYQFVIETTEIHAPGFDRGKISIRTSSKGRFQSITVYITATSVDQLESYHQALTAHRSIKMVL